MAGNKRATVYSDLNHIETSVGGIGKERNEVVPGEGETAIKVKVRTEEFGVKTEEVAKAQSPRHWGPLGQDSTRA